MVDKDKVDKDKVDKDKVDKDKVDRQTSWLAVSNIQMSQVSKIVCFRENKREKRMKV